MFNYYKQNNPNPKYHTSVKNVPGTYIPFGHPVQQLGYT